MACSKHVNYTYLDDFLDNIVATRLSFSQSNLEVQVVEQLVHKMVNDIAKEAYSADPSFTFGEVIPVESMAEGTRIIKPNEFDFMIVVDRIFVDDVTKIFSSSEGSFVELKIDCKGERCSYSSKKKKTGNPPKIPV